MAKHVKSAVEVLEEFRAHVNGKIERDMIDELDSVIDEFKRKEKMGTQSLQQRALDTLGRLLPAVTNIATLVDRFFR